MPQTGQEWDDLIRRCVTNCRDELLGHIRNIFEGFGPTAIEMTADQADDQLFQEWIEMGARRFIQWVKDTLEPDTISLALTDHWIAAYWIHQDLGKIAPSQFLHILNQVERREPGGPYWHVSIGDEDSEPRNIEGIIEQGTKPIHAEWHKAGFPFEFWRASPQGLMLLLRGYDEDFQSSDKEQRKRLRAENPIWDVAACCCHAVRLAKAIGVWPVEITIGFSWKGLRDRKLTAVKERKNKERICHQESSSTRVHCSGENIETNLPEIVRDLTFDLYQGFSFYEPVVKFFEEEISKLKKLTSGILEQHLCQ